MWLHYIWYRIKIRYQINTVPTPTVAWTRAWLLQEGGGGKSIAFDGNNTFSCSAPQENTSSGGCVMNAPVFKWDSSISTARGREGVRVGGFGLGLGKTAPSRTAISILHPSPNHKETSIFMGNQKRKQHPVRFAQGRGSCRGGGGRCNWIAVTRTEQQQLAQASPRPSNTPRPQTCP